MFYKQNIFVNELQSSLWLAVKIQEKNADNRLELRWYKLQYVASVGRG